MNAAIIQHHFRVLVT